MEISESAVKNAIQQLFGKTPSARAANWFGPPWNSTVVRSKPVAPALRVRERRTTTLALTKGKRPATLAALSAARQWQFTSARKHDKPVPSEVVLHFG